MIKNVSKIFCGILILVLIPIKSVFAVTIGAPVLVSKNALGIIGNGESGGNFSVTPDGRYVVFTSASTNLVQDDTNNSPDIFLLDNQDGSIIRVSVSSDGTESNSGGSSYPSISSDGRYVVFQSTATNLVTGDTNSTPDIFLRDVQLGITTRISLSPTNTQVSGESTKPLISSDGRYVFFLSDSTGLVAGDTGGYTTDIFKRDLLTSTNVQVSVSNTGVQSNQSSGSFSISSDGRYVVFVSNGSNLVSGDTNDFGDIFLRDTQLNTTTRVSVSSSGLESNEDSQNSNLSISDDGRYVLFSSYASNLVSGDTNFFSDVFLRDTQLNTTTRVSLDSNSLEIDDADSFDNMVSSDGRYVFFESSSDNVVSGDTNNSRDLFVRDTQNSTTEKITYTNTGGQTNGGSYLAKILPDMTYLYFYSDASNIVSGDTNNTSDIFKVSITPSISTPTISTTSATSITTTTAVLTGNITDTGGEDNTERGFDIGTDTSYTMTDITESGTYSTGSYSLTATGLTCNTTYHYRAYSTNSEGTSTGSDDTFTTSACPVTVTASPGGAVPVWILQSMSDNLRNTQNINQNTNTETPQTKFTFTKNLKQGMRDNEIKKLQEFLNSKGYIIAKSGPGSIGNETTYFGIATKNALIKFQKDNDIKPSVGYFGEVTRGFVKGL